MKLCTLTDVKALLDISANTFDTKLNLMIESASALVVQYLGFPVVRTTYTAEKYAVNNQQYLQLRSQPIQSVTAVTLDGVAVTDFGTEYDDMNIGLLYRGVGWSGRYYVRNLTMDPVSGNRDILVTYVAGWYLPGDVTTPPADPHYVADSSTSLPMGIQAAVMQAVIEKYRVNAAASEGIKAHSEGGISDTYGVFMGLSDSVCDQLNAWRRVGIA